MNRIVRAITGPQRKFCEGIISGLSGVDAYCAAYPNSSRAAARASAADLLAKASITAEIQRLRDAAQEKAGSAILTLAEKRKWLARLLRVNLSDLSLGQDGDLLHSIAPGKLGDKLTLCDKLAAIKLDNDLAGEGSEAEANDALGGLLERIMTA